MARFVNAQVPEVVQPFGRRCSCGEFGADAAAQVGRYRKRGTRWVAACGGVRPRRGRDLKGRCLTFGEREELALARARGETMRAIARRLGCSPSTGSRELRRDADRDGGYRATVAHALAFERASRPKPASSPPTSLCWASRKQSPTPSKSHVRLGRASPGARRHPPTRVANRITPAGRALNAGQPPRDVRSRELSLRDEGVATRLAGRTFATRATG